MAARIQAFEAEQEKSQGFRWPTLLAIVLGAVLLGAGVLLFVSAHWEELAPSSRFTLVLLMVALLHGGGALASGRYQSLAISLHAVGTVALGAGIALTGQIFNLAEHWPAGILLWAVGAAFAWAILRHWAQATLVAVLTPAWLVSEWIYAAVDPELGPVTAGVSLLAFTYLSARGPVKDGPFRQALAWTGGLVLLPSVAGMVFGASEVRDHTDSGHRALSWFVALGLPLAVAFLLRRRDAWMNAVCAAWVVVAALSPANGARFEVPVPVFEYFWCGLGAVGLIAWGVRDSRAERINLGRAGFAITVLAFYFSSVMDKLDRSASLIGLGVLFLAGGWALEKMRRRLVARVRPGAV